MILRMIRDNVTGRIIHETLIWRTVSPKSVKEREFATCLHIFCVLMLWWCCEWWINLISKVNAKCIIDKHNFRYVIQMQHGSKLILFSYFLDIEWYCIAFTRFRRFFLIMFIGVVFMLWFRFFLDVKVYSIGGEGKTVETTKGKCKWK